MKRAPKPTATHESSLSAIAGLVDGLRTIAESINGIQKERTRQTELRLSASVEIARIHSTRDVLRDYLERSFDERRANFDKLFERVDAAIAAGNVELVSATLHAVVTLAQSSPFKALTDHASTRAALQEKGKTWDF